ncbi:MAG: hypothetical protein HC945_04345, partial [Nitrosarchaeum sp.]|nr:hypothetical protein [Nitrosarchaeum sp.]
APEQATGAQNRSTSQNQGQERGDFYQHNVDLLRQRAQSSERIEVRAAYETPRNPLSTSAPSSADSAEPAAMGRPTPTTPQPAALHAMRRIDSERTQASPLPIQGHAASTSPAPPKVPQQTFERATAPQHHTMQTPEVRSPPRATPASGGFGKQGSVDLASVFNFSKRKP